MPFRSKKQWKWAFANKKSFAHEWARKTRSYKGLPSSKGSSSRARRRGPRTLRRR